MDNNESPKGFSGLSSMASTVTSDAQSDTSPAEYELISITKHPSMASPWTGIGPGEGWKWGDYYITIQERPETVFDTMAKMTKSNERFEGMTYHFAATVFRDPQNNKYGPSSRPVMVVGIEQSDMSAIAKQMQVDVSELTGSSENKMGPVMVGVFSGDIRMNMGEYSGPLTIESVRNVLLERIKERFKLTGEPERLGDIESVRTKVVTRKIDLDSVVGNSNSGFLGKTPLKNIPQRTLIIAGVIVVFVASGAIFKPAPLAGIFGTRNYEECVLHAMKGQQANLLPMARTNCRKSFPPEVEIDRSKIKFNWCESSATVEAVCIEQTPPRVTIKRIDAVFSPEDCGKEVNDENLLVTASTRSPMFGNTFKFDLQSGNRKCASFSFYGTEE